MKILSVVGARPNLVKIAPFLRALEAPAHRSGNSIASVLVHTGQHYDETLSGSFFADLQIRAPDHELGVGSGSHASMTAEVMRRVEPVLVDERPDLVVLVGDVNSTLACALTAAKLQIPVAHIEAGLRSFDRRMPEEINRVLTDAVATLLFTTEESANENLRREGHPAESIFFVGNVMIDSLLWAQPLIERSGILDRLGFASSERFALLTIHRPSNVDDAATLQSILQAARELARELPVIFPVHPRTRARIGPLGFIECTGRSAGGGEHFAIIEPVPYLDFLHLMSRAALVLTDSGGVQEETTCLGVPCLTLRENTERPVTVTAGTNTIVGTEMQHILTCARAALQRGRLDTRRPPLWDGHAAERIVRVLADHR